MGIRKTKNTNDMIGHCGDLLCQFQLNDLVLSKFKDW